MNDRLFKGLPIHDRVALQSLDDLFHANRSRVLSGLPWLVSELVEETSFPEALQFVYAQGGRKIYMSGDRQKFARALGLDLSKRLHGRIALFGDSSGYVEIPSSWGVSECLRRIFIQISLDAGMTREEIRTLYGVSNRGLNNLFSGRKGKGKGRGAR